MEKHILISKQVLAAVHKCQWYWYKTWEKQTRSPPLVLGNVVIHILRSFLA